MWSAREADPALAAQADAKSGMVLQVPREVVPAHIQSSPAKVFSNFVASGFEVERRLTSTADAESRHRKSLDKAPRRIIGRKPCSPNLHRHALRISRAAAAARIHQQVAEPPGTAAVGQSQAKKPHFIPARYR